jgi:hypothetical protein
MAVSQALQQLVWMRAGSRCEYCQIQQIYDALTFEIDHIIAAKHRGQSVEDNLALSCYACNHHKGANIAGLDPVSQQTTPLFHPRRDEWQAHFQWTGPFLEGKTAIGRVTVYVLAINLDYRVALRRVLINEGVFPP